MATHSSTLACKIPWTEEPGRLQFLESWRVEHNWATSLWLFTFVHWRRKWQPTRVFLPGEFQGRGSLVGCHLWGHKSQTWLKWLSSSSSSRIRSHEQVAASSIHSLGLRWPWPAVPFWSKASVPQPEIEVSSQKWEHQILAARPVVNDKALALRLCRKRIPTKTKSSKTKYLSRRRIKKREYSLCR